MLTPFAHQLFFRLWQYSASKVFASAKSCCKGPLAFKATSKRERSPKLHIEFVFSPHG